MKLILRKNDSATSLLLFIFNNYFSNTYKESLRLSSLLEILKVFDKNETAIRMSLSRAVKTGILTNSKQDNEVIYSLTNLGKESIERWNEGVQNFWKRYSLRNIPWDGKWHFINIDFSEDKDQKVEVSEKLLQLGFVIMNSNLWLCPFHLKDEIKVISKTYGLEAVIVEIIGEITMAKGINKFIEDVYDLDVLKLQYKEFVKIYSEKLMQTKELCKNDEFINSGKALILLQELGWNFHKITSEDAVLPMQLFPHWVGDEAVNIMNDFREILLPAAWKYLSQFEETI